jgi:hypothetical protein
VDEAEEEDLPMAYIGVNVQPGRRHLCFMEQLISFIESSHDNAFDLKKNESLV